MEDGGVAFALPTNLVEAARRDPFPERREWVDQLPEVVDELAGRLWPVSGRTAGGSATGVLPRPILELRLYGDGGGFV